MTHRSPWEDPNVQAALNSGRPSCGIYLICCGRCGTWGYYNEGSHFSCSVEGCGWSVRGLYLDAILEAGEVISLDDWTDMMVREEEEQLP